MLYVLITCLCWCACFFVLCCYIFFVNQKTAYEMRISDWSSDVCSSDLLDPKRTNAPAAIKGALTTPESPARITKIVVPMAFLEMPPKTVRIECRTMAAPTDRLERIMPSEIGRAPV